MSNTEYTIDARGTHEAASAILAQRRPLARLERALDGPTVLAGEPSITTALTAYRLVLQDAISALGNVLGVLGENVQVAVVNYQGSEADSSHAYRRVKREAI